MPAFTVAHGLLGLEGIHRLADLDRPQHPDRAAPDRTRPDHRPARPPRSRRQPRSQLRPRRRTGLPPASRRGRTITYEGRVLARDLYDTARPHPRPPHAAAAGRLGEDDASSSAPTPRSAASPHRYDARVLALEIDDEQTIGHRDDADRLPTRLRPHLPLSHDPRYYLVGADVTAGGAAGAVVTVTNPGNAPALPVFIVNGPVADDLRFRPARQRRRTQTALRRRRPRRRAAAPAGLHHPHPRPRLSDGESFEHKRVFDDSNWWDAGAAGLNAGATQITVDGGGTWTCTFAPANW